MLPTVFENRSARFAVVNGPVLASELDEAMSIRRRFLRPGDDEPYMIDIIRAFRLLEQVRDYAEVGTRDKGNLAWLVRRLPQIKSIVDVDIEENSYAEGLLKNVLPASVRYFCVTGDCLDAATVRAVRSATEDGKFDAIFCDSSHMYEHTLTEFAIYWELVRPGGLLLFHDVFWEGTQEHKGKAQAIQALDRHIPAWCVFMDEPVHRYLLRSQKTDVWGGVGIFLKPT